MLTYSNTDSEVGFVHVDGQWL